MSGNSEANSDRYMLQKDTIYEFSGNNINLKGEIEIKQINT